MPGTHSLKGKRLIVVHSFRLQLADPKAEAARPRGLAVEKAAYPTATKSREEMGETEPPRPGPRDRPTDEAPPPSSMFHDVPMSGYMQR